MMRCLVPALVIVALVGCGGRKTAESAAPAPVAAAKAETGVAEQPKTLVERLAEEAPGERPAEPAYDRVVPGMAATDIAKLIGRPDEVRERGLLTTMHWRTGGPRDPVYIVWLREGVAQRMRFSDRW